MEFAGVIVSGDDASSVTVGSMPSRAATRFVGRSTVCRAHASGAWCPLGNYRYSSESLCVGKITVCLRLLAATRTVRPGTFIVTTPVRALSELVIRRTSPLSASVGCVTLRCYKGKLPPRSRRCAPLWSSDSLLAKAQVASDPSRNIALAFCSARIGLLLTIEAIAPMM